MIGPIRIDEAFNHVVDEPIESPSDFTKHFKCYEIKWKN